MNPTSNIQQSQPSLHKNTKRSHNQLAFGIALILFQIIISILQGVYVNPTTSYINISSIIFAMLLAILVIVGITVLIEVSVCISAISANFSGPALDIVS